MNKSSKNSLKKPRKRLKQANNPILSDLAVMAADPDIQREIAAINIEFAVTEMDGLTALTDT